MMARRARAALLALALIAAPAAAPATPAYASGAIGALSGRGGDNDGPELLPVADAAEFSKQIERELASRGARVAVVFRAGRPREDMPDGVRYTHGAFWVYTNIETDDGRIVPGYAVYNLYSGADGDPLRSYLHQDFPFDFTLPMAIGEAGIIVPTPGVQQRILDVMNSQTYYRMHQPVYSLISNPHDMRFQNCNEFMLDVIAAGVWETNDRAQVVANLRAYFDATPIATNVVQRIFAPMADSRLRTSDHRGGVQTTTFESMARFMEEYELADAVFELAYVPPADTLAENETADDAAASGED